MWGNIYVFCVNDRRHFVLYSWLEILGEDEEGSSSGESGEGSSEEESEGTYQLVM